MQVVNTVFTVFTVVYKNANGMEWCSGQYMCVYTMLPKVLRHLSLHAHEVTLELSRLLLL